MANAINSLKFGENTYTFTLPYGTCSTAAGTAAKTVDVDNFSLETGARVLVKFSVTNTASSPTLNVESTGAKAIYYNGAAITAGYLKANKTYEFVYNGTQWELIGDVDTNTTYSLSSFGVTATAAELNKMDGVTATTAELNYVDGVTSNIQTQLNALSTDISTKIPLDNNGATALTSGYDLNELKTVGVYTAIDSVGRTLVNSPVASGQKIIVISGYGGERWHQLLFTMSTNAIYHRLYASSNGWTDWVNLSKTTLSDLGITATAAELNKLDGVTASTTEINKLKGLTPTTTELNYVDGVTSAIQTQLNGKQASITGAATTITDSNLTASRALISNSSGKVAVSAVTSTELGYLDGVTSSVQTQLNNKADIIKWSCPTTVGVYSRLCEIVNHGSSILTVQLSQSSQSSVHTFMINTGWNAAKICQIGSNGFTVNYNQTVRVVQGSDSGRYYIEILNNYGYNGATTTTITCRFLSITGTTCNPFTEYTATSDSVTVKDSVETHHDGITSSKFYGDLEGNANTATKLGTSSVGKASQPIYLSSGTPTKITAVGTAYGGTGATTVSGARTNLDVYSKSEVDTAVSNAKTAVKNDLLNGAGAAYDTLKELGALIDENTDAIEALETVAAGKANKSHTHGNITNAGAIGTASGKAVVTTTNGVLTTGTVPVASGGTGATTAAGALTNLGLTATAAELNKMDGVTATTAELNYVDGVTSNIQTQLNAKQATITGAATSIASSNLTASRALVSNSSGKVAVSAVTSTELGYLDGVTNNIQTQLDGKVSNTLGYVNKSLSWDSNSYYQHVILLFPVPQSATYVGYNFIDGRFFCWKTGGNVYDTIEINANCVYGSLRYHLEQFGDHPTTELCVCKYNNVQYYALKCPYHANPYNNVTFVGRIRSDLTGGTSTVALPLDVPYYNENTKTVLNSEVNSSITTTLTTTYVTSASSTSLYSKGGFSGSLNGNASTATALTSKSIGSATNPVYFDANGKPVKTTYTLGASVPSNAKFTDTDTKVTHSRTTTSSFRPIILHSLYDVYGTDVGSATDQLYYNEVFAAQPSTGTIRATKFQGALVGNADSATRLSSPSISTVSGTTYTIDNYLTLIKNTLPLNTQGYYTWKHSWSYASHGLLSAKIGNITYAIQLAGAHCEFNGKLDGEYVFRITTATTSGSTGANFITGATYQYNNHGSSYAPTWTLNNAIIGLSVSGKTITYTKNDGTTGTITTQDTNTTYTFNGAVSTIKDSNLTASRALISNSSGKVAVSAVTSTELGYLDGVTSAIQTQLNGKLSTSGGSLSGAITINKTAADKTNPTSQDLVLNYSLPSGGTLTEKNAPGIGFHIGNVNWANFIYDGTFKFVNNSFTGYAPVKASSFTGALKGNADTATKLATARTISLTGDVTGSGTFDGSSNLTITATVADNSHNHISLKGNTDNRNVATTPNDYNGEFKVAGLKSNNKIGSPSGDTYSGVIGFRQWSDNSGGNAHELAFNDSGLYMRSGATTSWGSWEKFITSASIGSQSVASATKATKDASGNTITSTYLNKTTSTAQTVAAAVTFNSTTASSSKTTGAVIVKGGVGVSGSIYGNKVYGAVWNDYAEYRQGTSEFEAGRVVCENGDDTLSLATERLQPGANIVSDTFGFAIGETETAKTPLAVSGRVLAYPYEDRESYKPGDAVCAAPNGTVSKMTREEIREYPERIIGTVSAVPTYETWGENNVSVNGRIWIKVK